MTNLIVIIILLITIGRTWKKNEFVWKLTDPEAIKFDCGLKLQQKT